MLRNSKLAALLLVTAMLVAVVAPSTAQEPIETVCLVTDIGRVNDGTFNQFAYEGLLEAVDDFDLDEPGVIETINEADYQANIDTCLSEGFEVIVTVGFLLQDATITAARENPDLYFIGIDQNMNEVEDPPLNAVGVQFREDQAGFLAGVLAAQVAAHLDSEVIAGIYGIDVPAVVRFRNGYEQGAKFVFPEWETGVNILGNYENSFTDATVGISAANQYIGEGASVIFGAGGFMGSSGIREAAQQGVFVIGVDQDEYFSSFQDPTTGLPVEGVEYLLTSAIKRVDQGVYDMVGILAEGDFDLFPGGENYLLDAASDGVGLAPKHESLIPDEVYALVEPVQAALIAGEISTGVDPVSGELLSDEEMADDEMADDGMADDETESEPAATEEADG